MALATDGRSDAFMNIWKVDRIMNRLDAMLDKAIAGERIEETFDETKMSALETKLVKYPMINQLGKEQLQHEKAKIGGLVSDISHQTKTPIANLLLYTELLEEEIQDEKSKNMIRAIHEQAERLSFLTNSLVKASRLENGIIQTVPAKNSVKELIEAVIAQIENKAALKNISLMYDLDNQVNCRAVFDMKWTGEAVYNIVDNAVKYTKAGGKVEILVTSYSLFTRIDIKDEGIGIQEDDVSKIFGRFYRCANVQQEEGVGLGLFLAREIISAQGGYIKVKSKINVGSTFSVFLKNILIG